MRPASPTTWRRCGPRAGLDDFLTIDRSFISQLGRGDRHDEQRLLLRAMGCDQAQGWLFGRPAEPA